MCGGTIDARVAACSREQVIETLDARHNRDGESIAKLRGRDQLRFRRIAEEAAFEEHAGTGGEIANDHKARALEAAIEALEILIESMLQREAE